MPSAAECDGYVTAIPAEFALYVAELAQNLAQTPTAAEQPLRARISFPYRSGFNRAVRLIGLAALLGSSLGVLAAVAGFPVNFLTMVGVLGISLALIGYSLRPSLRRPKF